MITLKNKNTNIKKHTKIILNSILLLIIGLLSNCNGAGSQVDAARAQLLERVRNGEIDFSTASTELTGDREVMIAAVQKNGVNLRYASEELKGDRDLVLEAIRQNVFAFWAAAETLRNDSTIGMEAVRNSAIVFQDTPQFWGNREIALLAVRHRGWNIKWTLEVTETLINDTELFIEAVSQDGLSLQFASKALREDKEVVMKAISQNGKALEHASKELREDKEIVIYAMRRDREALRFASQELQQEEQELEAAANSCIEVSNAPNTIAFTLDEIKTDEAQNRYIQVLASLTGVEIRIPLILDENLADFATRLRIAKFPEQENIYLTLITKQGTPISPLSWEQLVTDFVQ